MFRLIVVTAAMLILGFQAQAAVKWNNSGDTSSNLDMRAVLSSMQQDGTGLLRDIIPSPLISKDALEPITVSDFSILGETSIKFELNEGECGEEPKWSDCENNRERTELVVGQKEKPKREKWYRFLLYFPKEHKQPHPAKLSVIQWKRFTKSGTKVAIMFQHLAGGLVFNRNGQTFKDSYALLVDESNLYERWIEIVFNTNWHPDQDKGFMRVWVDGTLKIDFEGASYSKTDEELSLRYGLYSSWLHRFKAVSKNEPIPTRMIFFDGVKATNKCSKMFSNIKCDKLKTQNVEEYDMFVYEKRTPKIHDRSIQKIPAKLYKHCDSRKGMINYCKP